MPKAKESPVFALLSRVWRSTNAATGHSWERLNHSMYQALRLAIGAGFPFTVGDFKALDDFRYHCWIGDREWFYAMAIAEGNESAAKAYEEWLGRRPLIADDVTPADIHAGFAHLTGTRQRERLHVGCQFPWKGERVKLTSFSGDGSAVACSYRRVKEGKGTYEYESEKILHRYRITREAIIAERAERKERSGIEARLTELTTAGKVSAETILKELGAKTKQEYAVLPLKKLRTVAQRILSDHAEKIGA